MTRFNIPHVPSPERGRRAFGLIEMLAATAILVALVGVVGMIFTDSVGAWSLTTGRAEMNATARLALGMMARDIEQVMADELITFRVRTHREALVTYGAGSDELCCVSLQNDSADTNRAARQVCYWVRPSIGSPGTNGFELVRGEERVGFGASGCYATNTWYEGERPAINGILARNVAAFQVEAVGGAGGPGNDYDSELVGDRPPLYVDIHLELMSDRTRRQVAELAERGLDWDGFLERNVRTYTRRVYVPNRSGYRKR